MRNIILATVLAVAAAFGTVQPSRAQAADVRVFVDLGDVAVEYGRPYYRYNHEPLYVIYDDYNRPRYYRVVNRDYYRYYYNGYYHSSPPPWAPAYGWRYQQHRHQHHYYNDDNRRWHDGNND